MPANTSEIEEMKKYFGWSKHRASSNILQEVQRRNAATVTLNGYQPKFEVRATSADELKQLYAKEDFDSPRCLLFFALPGYSSDGHTAYVFFQFADGGMHGGGTGVYCMHKGEAGWKVAWKYICIIL